MSRFGAVLAILFSATPLCAQEVAPQPAVVDYRLVALRVAEDFIEPRYGVLAARAQAQREAWVAFCKAKPADTGFNRLMTQFVHTVNAWANVELVRYGPVATDFLYERIAYWPERKNDVARALTRVLADQSDLSQKDIYGKSVAVQGLSALERLLYEEGARAALFDKSEEAKRRCALGMAIAGNVEVLAQRMRDEWPALKERLRTSDEALAREAVTRLATDLLTIYQVMADQKLQRVLGESAEEARPTAAQWWRSDMSAQTLAFNLKSAADLIWILLGPSDERHQLMVSIGAAENMARDLPSPLHDMAQDEKERIKLVLLLDMVRSARDLTQAYVPRALGITLGFNSLDGD